jgi:ankyrin repeat protein
MTLSVSDQCNSCLVTLQKVISILSKPDQNDGRIKYDQVCEELDRFSLFTGNIGALHRPESPMSVEFRLREANDVLIHILRLLADLNEVAEELLVIVSGKRVADEAGEEDDEEISEVNELREEISETITRLFRTSILIRQAAPADLFAKALSRNRYRFNDQFDIAHVGEKYPKLARKDYAWLRQRLGRAITQRRHYLSYIQDHHEKLGGMLNHHDKADSPAARSQAPIVKQPLNSKLMLDTASRPSFFTKATTVAAERITPQLVVAEESDSEHDARSYTTISRSIDGDHELSTTIRIPKLEELRIGNKKEFECPFCCRIKKFKTERIWRKHVFSDLRPYVCTFTDCDAAYFGDINKWFQHEMTFHRVVYRCFLCPNKVYCQEKKYLSHLEREHAKILDDCGEQQRRDLARKPLAQIPASDCPCCTDWVDRLKERVTQTSGSASNEILAVTPTVFKRHLAGHLEQLALFAVPIGAATNGDNNSNAAMEEGKSKRTDASQLSTLTFASCRDHLEDAIPETEVDPPESEILQADTQVNEIEAEANNEPPYSPPSEPIELVDKDGVDHSNTLNDMAKLVARSRNQGRWEQEEALQLKVIEASKTMLGQEHPHTLTSMASLASRYIDRRRWKEAEELLLHVMEIRKRVLGDEHPDTLTSMASAMQAASAGGHEAMVKMLLDKGADINAQSGQYGNALQAASSRGHEAVVRLLLDKGADVNAQGGEYGNALQAAVSDGNEAVVRLLLDKGADVNAQGGEYGNALQAASSGGHEQIAKLLLNKGADVNAQGGLYSNALQAASRRGYEEVVRLLLSKGADINAQGGYYGNALQAASFKGYEAVVRLLLDKGADVNAQGGEYGNALQEASFGGHEAIVKMLLDKGADINAQGGEYGNALQAASSRGYEAVVRLLLDKGADVNAQGGEYGNALQAAVSDGNEAVVRLLLDKGADVNAQGGKYGNALQAASSKGHEQIVKLLLDRGAVTQEESAEVS